MSGSTTRVRPPAVAGLFYPERPERLAAEVDAHLAGAPHRSDVAPKALIVPHAGYVYSGPVAGAGYAQVAGRRGHVRRVVLLGPAHRVPVRDMAVPTVDAFLTPLGRVPVDDDARQAALALPGVVADDRPHGPEHSLEVHLPFLQRALGPAVPERPDDGAGWSVLPVVVGDATDHEVAELIDALWGGDETLIVVSTDLSHYHDHRTAQRLDAATVSAIVGDDLEAIGPGEACGAHPVRGLLAVCRRRGLRPRLVDQRTSADTAGDPDRVVGYAALAVDETHPADRRAATLDAVARQQALEVARAALRCQVTGGDPRSVVDLPALGEVLRRPGASFVTLRSRDGALRGCLGSIEAHQPLAVDIADNAGKAATADPRFPPVHSAELPELDVHVAVLTEPTPACVGSWPELRDALRPGVDGLIIDAGRHRATFLPAVWDQLPDPAEFLDHLWRKAGLAPRTWPHGLRIARYEALEVG